MSANDKSKNRISLGIILINCLLLFLSFRQMEIARDYANDASREASKAAFRIKVASEETTEILKSVKEKHDDISTNFAIRKERPMVAIVECCNEVPIKSPGFVDAIELRAFEEFDEAVHGNNRQLRLRSKYAFVAQVENVGTGPATETRVDWTIDKVFQRDGKITSVEEAHVNEHNRPYTWNALVVPGGRAMILHPPTFVTQEGCERISRIEGKVLIQWKDTMGNSYETTQPFTMDAILSPDENDKIGKRLSFHFPLPSRPSE